VKYNPPPDDGEDTSEAVQQSTDRKGGGMSGKLKKKLMKDRRRRKKEAQELSTASPDLCQDSVTLDDAQSSSDDGDSDGEGEASNSVDVSADGNPSPAPASSQTEKKNSIRTLILQFSELGSVNDKASKKARDKQHKSTSCKHFFTSKDIKIIKRWLDLLPKMKLRIDDDEESGPRWDLINTAFQSGPFSGSKVFEINRLANAVIKWKSAHHKGCSYMDKVLEVSYGFATWLIVSHTGEGGWMSRNQRETMESFRNRLGRMTREEEEEAKELVILEDEGDRSSTSRSSDCEDLIDST
jgi:hypothetical protein